MFLYLSVYLLAAVLLFQGVNLLVEQSGGDRVVPDEVLPPSGPSSRWGGYLTAFGGLLALAGILSHLYPWLVPALAPLRNLGLASLAVFGLWLVFGAKVDYLPAPGAGSDSHGQAH
jgi:hypothetical protein